MMDTSRRPSISTHEYPEDLNPFKDETEDSEDQVILRRPLPHKDTKNKFWTFGRSRKKRSNSFSIKSTWNGIFGKRKEEEKKPTISTVSSTYKRTTYNNYPTETPATRLSKDQQEFDEALGTLTRRRKNTLDYPSTTSSRYGSSLTVNGDPGRIYDGCPPQETTTSIMGELTPKPPARRSVIIHSNVIYFFYKENRYIGSRTMLLPKEHFQKEYFDSRKNFFILKILIQKFGQVTAKRDIPPLQYSQENKTPIPPRRGGVRSSQRLNVPNDHHINSSNNSIKSTVADENENMPEDYVFKRVNHDSMAGVRKSNLSINSCVSMTSVYASGRKKRRAPPPPTLKCSKLRFGFTNICITLEILVRLTFNFLCIHVNICTLQKLNLKNFKCVYLLTFLTARLLVLIIYLNFQDSDEISEEISKIAKNIENLKVKSTEKLTESNTNDSDGNYSEGQEVKVEIKKQEETRCEIIKDVEIVEDKTLLRKKSKESIGSDSSFSVKDEIEKIERQIKLLEATKAINNDEKAALRTRTSSRRSLQENRRNFFKELTSRSSNNVNINNNINHNNDRVKVEIKELPRQQNDIKIVHLTDEVEHHDNGEETADNSAVKVIELRISEPLKVKSDFNFEVNPIPKPVRHNSNCSLDKMSTVNINNNNNKNISTVDVNDNNRDNNEEQSL
ncbi:GSCOCG00013150001-RA-CDS [Cotesia congregata]|nr:GSCOCG00013150001-RA-CDS [Cotesia congregata]